MILFITGFSSCNDDQFLSQDTFMPGDLSYAILSFDDNMGAFAKPSIEQGGYVFTDGLQLKANLEGYPLLNLTHNRWGWAGNIKATTASIEVPVSITNTQFYKESPKYSLFLDDIEVGFVTICSQKLQLQPFNSAITSNAITIFAFLNPPFVLSSGDIIFEIFDETLTNVIYSKTIIPTPGKNFIGMSNNPASVNQPIAETQIPDFQLGENLNVRIRIPIMKTDGTTCPTPASLRSYPSGSDIMLAQTYEPPVYTNTYYLIPTLNNFNTLSPGPEYGTVSVTNDASNLYYNISLYDGYNFIPVEGPTIFGFVGNPVVGQAIPINIPFTDISSPFTSYRLTIPFNSIPQYTIGGLINTKIVCRLNIENTTGSPGEIMPVMGYKRHWWMSGLWLNTNIPSSTPTQEFPLYADAGLNDISKGVLIGHAYLRYDGATAKIKYSLTPEFQMTQIDIYANDAAVSTLSPPPYGYQKIFDTPVNEFEVMLNVPDINLDGKAWFILHVNAKPTE